MDPPPQDRPAAIPLIKTARQERLLRLLALVGPGPAALYRDALRTLNDGGLETARHFVGHCLREIESSIRGALLPETVGAGDETHKRQVLAILERLGMPIESESASLWLSIAAGQDPLHREAHRDALMAPRPLDEAFRQRCDGFELLLVDVLTRFEGAFAGTIRLVDELAEIAEPSKAHVKRFRATPHNPVTLSRFFAKARVGWLPPLHKKRYFPSAPGTSETAEAAAACAFLARVAPDAPPHMVPLLREVALAWPETANPWICRYLAAVALSLPIEDAITLSGRLGVKLGDVKPGFSRELANVALHLIRAGRGPAGLALMRAILDAAVANEHALDAYDFEELAKGSLLALAEASGDPALIAILDALEHVSRLPADRTERSDEAATFRRSVAAANFPGLSLNAYSSLIDLARRVCERIATATPSRLPQLLAMLEQRAPVVFQRIRLHLLGMFPAAAGDVLEQSLLDPTTFDSEAYAQERRVLERAGFALLSPESKAGFLEMIARGPDLTAFGDLSRFPPEHVEGHIAEWKQRHYAHLVDVLPEDVRSVYDELVRKHGSARDESIVEEDWDLGSASGEPPQLETLDHDALLQFLRTWAPPKTRSLESTITIDAVGRSLSTLVAKRPSEFSKVAATFRDLRPTYVRSVIDGLASALAGDAVIEWPSVLELATWLSDQCDPDDVDWRQAWTQGEDPGWRWAHMALARLLRAGLRDGSGALPTEFDAAARTVVEKLVDVGEPETSFSDPFDAALNSVRGTAAEALILLARRDAAARGNQPRKLPTHLIAGLDGLLKRAVDAGVRAMFGAYLPTLIAIDPEWVALQRPLLLPKDEAQVAVRDALWVTYLTKPRPTRESLRLLADDYAREVEALQSSSATINEDRMHGLVHHIVGFYLNGFLSLDHGLVRGLFQSPHVSVRTYVLRHIGFSFLHNAALGDAMRQRAMSLWDWRSPESASVPAAERGAEFAEFGWWFASGSFVLEWSLARLDAVLDASPRLELDWEVAKKLGATASAQPRRALQLLSKMILASEDWSVLGCKEGIETAVRAALSSDDPDAERLARDLIGRLAARGHTEFVALI